MPLNIVQDNSGGSGNTSDFSVSVLGTVSQVDVYNQSNPSSSSSFVGDGITGIRIKYTGTSKQYAYLCKMNVYVDGRLWKRIDFYGGSLFWKQCDCVVLSNSNQNSTSYPYAVDVSLTEKTVYQSRNPYYESDLDSSIDVGSLTFSTAGTKRITCELFYYKTDSADPLPVNADSTQSWIHYCDSSTFTAGYLTVCSPVVESISVSGGKSTFYAGETFSYSTLVVTASYKYAVSSESAGTQTETGYSIGRAAAQSLINSALGGNVTKTGNVTVTFGGKSATYGITVYAVASYTKPYITSVRNTGYFRIGESYISMTSTVTYTDGTTDTASVSVSGLDTTYAHVAGATLSIVTGKTGETLSWTSTYIVVDVYKITVVTSGATLNFNMNSTLSSAGIVVYAHYGNSSLGDIGGTKQVTPTSVVFPTKEVGPNKPVTVNYSEGGSSYSTTYNININGLYEMSADYAVYGDHLRVQKNKSLSYGSITFRVRKYVSGALQSWTTSTPTVTLSGIDTANVGNQTATFSCSEDGATVSCQVPVVVYEHVSLSVTNVPTKPIIYDSSYPTLDLSKFRVVATTSDGEQVELSYNAMSDGYEVLLNGSAQSNDEITLTQSETLVIRSKDEPSVTYSVPVTIEQKAAKPGGQLLVSGGVVYAEVGQTIDLSGFTVLQEMNDGTYEEIDDYSCVIYGKSGLVFSNSDTLGNYYDLVFSKSPSASTTKSGIVMLNGISSISDTTLTKSVYDIGDFFDSTTVRYTINYYHGAPQTLQSGNVTVLRTDSFALGEAGNSSAAGSVVVNLLINGFSKSVTVKVRKAVELIVTHGGDAYPLYNVHQALDQAGKGVSYTAKFNSKTDGTNYDTMPVQSGDVSYSFINGGTGCSANDLIPDITQANEIVSVTASYSYRGVTVSAADNIKVIALKSVSLVKRTASSTAVSKVYFDKGAHLDLSDYYLRVVKNNNDVSLVEINQSTQASPAIGAAIMNKAEGATLSYTYVQGDTMNATYDIHVHYVSGIVTNLASKVAASYFVGDTLDLSAVTASRTITSTDANESGYPKSETLSSIQFTVNSMNITGTSYTFANAGSHEIAFWSDGIKSYDTCTVVAIALSSITKSTSALFKAFNSYIEGQRLSLVGLTITKNYNNGGTTALAYNDAAVEIIDGDGEPFSKTKLLALADNGMELFAKVTEGEATKTVSIGTLSVVVNELSSIEISSQSAQRTAFTYGDAFSVDSLVVVAHFTNGSSSLVSLSDLSFSGATVGHVFNPSDDTTFGNVTITVSYTHSSITKTTTYTISLNKPVLTSISTNAASDAVVTQFTDGDTYSESGLAVTGTFANGWTASIASTYWSTNATSVLTLNNGVISMTGHYGAKTITVSSANPYDSNQAAVTTTYTVDISSSGAIVSAMLMFDADSDYDKYTVGDTFTARGVYFHVTDIDGNENDARSFSTSVPVGTVLRSAQRIEIVCTYTKGQFTQTATYKILVSVPNLVTFTETNDYKLAIGLANGNLFDTLVHDEQTIRFGVIKDSAGNATGEYYPLFHENKVQIDGNQSHANTYGYNVYTGANAQADCIGYIDLGVTASDGTVVRQAHVILFDDPINPIDGQGNIEVTFPHYVEGYADRINKCRFGIVYNNRLFVSGNPNYKSCDWHSGAVNVSQEEKYDRNADLDFTYFSDLDYCYYGTDDTAVVGYDIYRDGELIVVKEGSRFQATLYRRSYKLVAATSYDGSQTDDTTLAEEAFPMFDVNANGGIGGLSNRSIVNFAGETLVLTTEGLKAISSKESVYGGEKYAVSASTYINPAIVDEEPATAFAYTFGDSLYLKTNRGVYVGYNELRNEDGEYEWYFLCDIPATLFFDYDGELYFANDEGGMFRFPKKVQRYTDKERFFVGETGAYLDIDETSGRIIVSNAYAASIKEGRPFHLLTKYNVSGVDVASEVYASLGYFVNADYRENILELGGSYDDTAYNGIFDATRGIISIGKKTSSGATDIVGTLEIQDLYYDGRKVRFDSLSGNNSAIEPFVDYRLSKVDTNNKVDTNKYKVLDKDGNAVSLAGLNTMRMVFSVNELAVTFIQNVSAYGDSGAKQFSLLGDHSKALKLVYYNNQNGYYSGVVTAENNVKSFYVTAPYSMGTFAYSKTVWAWIVANDTDLASYMDVGYISSRKQGGFETVVKTSPGSRELDFGGYNFSKVSFLNDSLPHVYSKYRTLPSVDFIRFVFKNEEDSNVALTSLEVIYTVSGFAKGVK